MPRTTASEDDESLKRLGGGRWETRDGRFTIEPQSGTWAVVDAEESNELGMPLVRGPFRSLTDAKRAIAEARESVAPTSPLAGRLEGRPTGSERDAGSTDKEAKARSVGDRRGKDATRPPEASRRDPTNARESRPESKKKRAERADRDEEPEEPGWFRELEPSERGRARRLIERLTAAGARDAVSVVRRDLAGDVPAVAAEAIRRRLAELPPDAGPDQVVELLADGRDDALGVRWRVVDGEGRPIVIDIPKRSRPAR